VPAIKSNDPWKYAKRMQATCNFGDGFKINPEYLTKFKNPAKVARFLRAVCMFW